MAGPIAIDTPDYQRGVVNAQKLLAAVPAGTDHVTVGVPPNAETLIVTASNVGTNPTVYVEGTGTLYKFPGKLAIQQPFITSAPTWFFDVSQSVDSSVLVQFSAAPGEQWYVYADAAAHLAVDPSKLTNGYGQQYVIPTVPSTLAGDHPPVELSYLSAYLNVTGDVVAAPGAGKRYRVFAAQMGAQTAGVVGGLRGGAAGPWFATCGVSGDSHVAFPLTGLPLPANQSINYQLVAGAGFMLITVAYTTETV